MAKTVKRTTVKRTVELKLVLPNNSEEKQALLDTHRLVNEAAAEYERVFMLIRQQEYYDQEKQLVSKEEVVCRLKKYFLDRGMPLDGERLECLRKIYDSFLGVSGSAPSSHSVSRWAATLFGSGRAESEDKKFQELRNEAAELGLLPLFRSRVITDRLRNPPRGNTTSLFDKMALRIAAAHIASWNECNKNTEEKFDEAQERLKKAEEEYAKYDETLRNRIDEYLSSRRAESGGFETEDDFLITERMVGDYKKIRNEWLKCGSERERHDYILRLQSGDGRSGNTGDPNFYIWLAREENRELWQTEGFIEKCVEYHKIKRKTRRLSPQAKYTFPDALKSPRWLMYEYDGGANLENYVLEADGKSGMLTAKLPLLLRLGDEYEKKKYCFRCAPNAQFSGVSFFEAADKKDKKKVSFFNGNENFTGELGGAEVIVKLKSNGEIECAYLKIAIGVEVKEPYSGFGEYSLKILRHFETSLNKSKKIEICGPARILSVDLGQRSFAACSVFEIRRSDGVSDNEFSFPANVDSDSGAPYRAVHERSFLLKLPGEDVSDKVRSNREKAFEKLRSLEAGINSLSDCLKILNQNSIDRKKEKINELLKYKKHGGADGFSDLLSRCLELNLAEDIDGLLKAWFESKERELSQEISVWRKETKSKRLRDYYGGKSMWMIEYLTNVRRLLLKWSNHPRNPGEIRRMDAEQYGTQCKRLLEHISNLKEDRIKTGVDMIIQAARGYVYSEKEKKWVKKFEPCNVIVFEDLRRYSFAAGRTRKENSGLMKWCHRSVVKTAEEIQAPLYAIQVSSSTEPRYTSVFYAKNCAPGIRCRPLKKEDFYVGALSGRLRRELENKGYADSEIEKLKEGDIVPFEGGELFATLCEGRLKIVHADLNAAWNIARRFATRHEDLIYIYVKAFKSGRGGDADIEEFKGERLRGALKAKYGSENIGIVEYIDAAGNKGYKLSKKDRLSEDERQAECSASGAGVLLRDASGQFFEPDVFYPADVFWDKVKREITSLLKSGRHGANQA